LIIVQLNNKIEIWKKKKKKKKIKKKKKKKKKIKNILIKTKVNWKILSKVIQFW